MGCSSSKVEEEAAVQICKDRKDFIKQAIIHRNKFTSSHIAYINSLKGVPIALKTCVDEDRFRYFLDSCKNHKLLHDKTFIQPHVKNSYITMNYSESCPESSEFITIEPYNIFAANSYWNPFFSIDEERESKRHDISMQSYSIGREYLERENVERESSHVKEVVREERKNSVAIRGGEAGEENLPGFTFHINRIPTSLADVMKDLEVQFKSIADVASEVAILLEVHTPNQNSLRDRMTPRRNQGNNRAQRDDSNPNSNSNGNSSDVSEEPFQLFKSHKSTLERLYAWEKKLNEEVKDGERLRLAYEKKHMQLKNQDIFGAEPSAIDKTRASIRDLRTKLNISITSVQSISKRIETLRDKELHPQLISLIQGLTKLWRTISDAHRIQNRAINEAKQLLQLISLSSHSPPPPVCLSASLASELLNWRTSLSAWLSSQKSYVTSLSKWAQNCVADPLHGGQVYEICLKWAKVVEECIDEEKAVEGIKSFEERMKAMVSEGKKRKRGEEREREEDWRLGFCEGLGEAVGVLGRFMAVGAGEYEELVRDLNEGRREPEAE
ncbi:hypothetical protein LUZ60_017260 [Juncus effusus]|nr:hypothetical protein LUZ60_017260 [Juncus effusus]